MNNPQPTDLPTINDAKNLIRQHNLYGKESESSRASKFVRLGNFVFRPHEVDWFYLEPSQETPEGKLPDQTIVWCKGHCAFLDDEDHQLHSFLVEYFNPRVVG